MPKPVAPDGDAIALEILRQTAARGPAKSICPSEVARALAGPAADPASGLPWQRLLDPVRQAALRLQREGRVEILRKGRPVSAAAVRGVIRLRIAVAPGPDVPGSDVPGSDAP